MPPSLIFGMVLGNIIVSSRLSEVKVTCLVESKIPFSGRIKTMCFDKTGTLTTD